MDSTINPNLTKPDDISNDKSLIFDYIKQKYHPTHDYVITNEKYKKITEKDLKNRKTHTQGTEDNPKLYEKFKDDTSIKNSEKIIYKIIDQKRQERLHNLDEKIKNLEDKIEEKKKNLEKNTEAAGQDFDTKIQNIIDNNKTSNDTFDENNKRLKDQIGNLQSMSFFGKIKNLFSASGAETSKLPSLLEFLKSPKKILGKVIDVAITSLAVAGAASFFGPIVGVIAAGIGIFYIIYKTADEATEVQISNLKDKLNELTMDHSNKLLEFHNNLTSVAQNAVGDIRKNSELINLQIQLDQKRAEYCTLKTKALQKVVDSQKVDIERLNREIKNANDERLGIQKSLQDRTKDLIKNIENQQNILQSYGKSIDSILSANKNITDAHRGIAKEIEYIQAEINSTRVNLNYIIAKLSTSSQKIGNGDQNNITEDIKDILKTSSDIVKTAISAMDKIFEKTNNINTALNKISEANQSLEKISDKQEELQKAKLENNKALAGVLVAMLGKKDAKKAMETLKGLELKPAKDVKLNDLAKKLYGIHNGETENEKLEENEFIETISIIKSIANKAKEDQKLKISELISKIEKNNELLVEGITDLGEKIKDINNGLKGIESSNDAIKALSDENGAINSALKASNDIAEKMKDIKIVYINNGWFSWLGNIFSDIFEKLNSEYKRCDYFCGDIYIGDYYLIS